MKRMRGKASQSKPTQASVSSRWQCSFGDTQDQFFGFPTEKLVAGRVLPRLIKRQSADSNRRLPTDAHGRTLRNKSIYSQDDQYLAHLDHKNSEKVNKKKDLDLSKTDEDELQSAPIICKRTWLRQVKIPTSKEKAINRKHRSSSNSKVGAITGVHDSSISKVGAITGVQGSSISKVGAITGVQGSSISKVGAITGVHDSSISKVGAITGVHDSSISPRCNDVVRKENGVLKGDINEFQFVSQTFSNSDCLATCRNTLQVRNKKDLSPECPQLQSLQENQIKSVPSQSWSVNADAIPLLRRSSSTVISHQTYFKPQDELRFQNRKAGDLSGWWVEGLDLKAVEATNKQTEDSHPIADSSKSKSSNGINHQNIKKKISAHKGKVGPVMSKSRSKPKRIKDKVGFNDLMQSQSLSSKRRSRIKNHLSEAESEETDLSMIPMKDSYSKESLMSSSSDDSDNIKNILSKCSTFESWVPYNEHAEESTLKCTNIQCPTYLKNFESPSGHCGSAFVPNSTEPHVKTSDFERFMRIRLKSTRAESLPERQNQASKMNLDSLTDSGDWSKFTPVCHIYDGSAPSKLSSANLAFRCDDDSIQVINIDDPHFLKASDIAVASDPKDTTSTWMTGQLDNQSQVSLTSSNVEEQTLENKQDGMPAYVRVKPNRITLNVESMGMRLQRNNEIRLLQNGEKSRSTIKNDSGSVVRGQITRSSSSDGISETNPEGPKITYSFNKQEDKKTSSKLKKHNGGSEHISFTEKNVVNITPPPKSQLTAVNAVSAHDNFIKRSCFQRRKQNHRNIFAKSNRHKGLKEQSKYLKTYNLPKREKHSPSARSSPTRTTRTPNNGLILTEPMKVTSNRATETPIIPNDPRKDIGLQCSKNSPGRVSNEKRAGEKQAIFASTQIKRKTQEFKRSMSYPVAIKEDPKIPSGENNDLETPDKEQGVQRAETVLLTVTNVQTSTTNFFERCTPGEVTNRRFGRRFRIRVFVKPSRKRDARSVAHEAYSMTIPVAHRENINGYDVAKCEITSSPKSFVDFSIEPSSLRSISTQFQSLGEFPPASPLKSDPSGVVRNIKHTRDPSPGKGGDPLNASPPSATLSCGATQGTNHVGKNKSITEWEDVFTPSPKARRTKPIYSKIPCLPRYPKRYERRHKVKPVWDQIQSEITPIVRPIIFIMLFMCIIYLTLMTAFSLHAIQRQ